jgi:hypothetical protein
MINEKWIRWNPLKNLTNGNYYVFSTKYYSNSLEVLIENYPEKKVAFKFLFRSVLFCRITEESSRILTINYLNENYNERLYSKWTFFKVYNSEYLKIISDQPMKIVNTHSLTHFSFIDVDNISDVVALGEPEISEIDVNLKKSNCEML